MDTHFFYLTSQLTVAALFIVARAVDSTGIVDRMMKRLLGKPSSLFFAQLRLLLPVALFSGFMKWVKATKEG